MKFLDVPSLAEVTSYLDERAVGSFVIEGRTELYSCKETTADKRLRKELEKTYAAQIKETPDLYSTSPLGSMHQPKVRRNLINMIITMNAAFPDYDFRSLKAEHFVRRFDHNDVVKTVNGHLAIIADPGDSRSDTFIDDMWRTIDKAISIKASKIWSYVPEFIKGDPFADANALWSFNYFFYNEEKKQILYFRCLARSRFAADSDDDEGDSDDDDDSEEKLVADEDDGDDDEYEMNQHEYHRESWEQGDSGDEPFRIDDL